MTSTSAKLFNYLKDSEKKIVQGVLQFSSDEKLAWLYFVYLKMGDSITPAAPTSADPNLSPILLGTFYEQSQDEQLAIMRQIASGEPSEYSRYYGALTENNRLLVWYAWAQAMGSTVVGLPQDYSASDASNQLLTQIQQLDFQEQISVLRAIVSGMGYSDVAPIPDQTQTGKTDSL